MLQADGLRTHFTHKFTRLVGRVVVLDDCHAGALGTHLLVFLVT